jgi:uncharacterized membrane protein YbhN (UPF0104 family)
MKKLIIVQFIITILSIISIVVVFTNGYLINNSNDWELRLRATELVTPLTNLFLGILVILYILNISIFMITVSNKLGGNNHAKKR